MLWEKGKLTRPEVDKAVMELLRDDSSDVDMVHAQEIIEKANHDENTVR